jgi:UDP-GlcNAc3NAcA epimerase
MQNDNYNMKIVTILGARPQFIKAGTVSRAIMEHNQFLVDGFSFLDREKQKQLETKNKQLITEIIIHTGQHYDANMSDIFFKEMKIPRPDYLLGIGGKSHGAMTGQMIEKIEEVLVEEKPDWIMVYGDTDSTLAGAIAASKLHIKIAHIEAGLRSYNMKMPEEINRILTDRISDILFCPTDTAVENLKDEGFENFGCKIIKSGDVMQDGAIFYKQFAKQPKITNHQSPITNHFILSTIHRAENTDDESRLKNIFEAFNEIAKETQIILPLHPRTKNLLPSNFCFHPNLTIIDPVGYLEMVWLIDNCKMVMTDSGGLQKEAFFFQKPCITIRDETEWVELTENRFNVLSGADKNKIVELYHNYKFNNDFSVDLYGGGKASKRVVKQLLEF